MTRVRSIYGLGLSGLGAGWTLTQIGDVLSACPDGGVVDDALSLYDAGDDRYGCVVNVTAPQSSEWGCAAVAAGSVSHAREETDRGPSPARRVRR